MDEIEKIFVLVPFKQMKHTMVTFNNGSNICSCKLGFAVHKIPNLRN